MASVRKRRHYRMVDGRTIRERHYRVSETGLAEWNKTIAFYTALDLPDDDFRPVPVAKCYQYE
ncbi:MAG: hypothetical protein ABIP48_21850 [Planctomycetota bacterium]